MNAYETPLIELLKKVPIDARHIVDEEFSSTCYPVGRLCSQAADRIVELEKLVSELKYEKSSGVYDKPIAWVDQIWISRPDLVKSQQLDIGKLFMRHAEGIKNYIPLYTHPQKELSDEEIEELAQYHGIDSLYETGRIDFARAIEKELKGKE